MLSNVSNGVKVALFLIVLALTSAVTYKVASWKFEADHASALKGLSDQLQAMTHANGQRAAQIETLKAEIQSQSFAVTLAEQQAESAKSLQALAMAEAAKQTSARDARIKALERDLADQTLTVNDLLYNAWRKAQ
ncbi:MULTISPECIES: hypothetical protein [Pseudomonas]|uniref:Lysis protein n=1 Tax=Pseudomonas lutea TaxID=243924 RepID=A0A9X8MH82_9PSED|nr:MULTISPECIES: hypothetical protein [Pseudomonas]SER38015.1 hypothetical protein SAMN05216409_118121 [Pseudomonas lutea]